MPTLPRELLLYGLLSGVALAVDTGVFLFGLNQHLPWVWAATLGFATGLAISYCGSTWWVFSQHKLHNRGVEFVIYGLIGGAGLLLTQLSLWLWLAVMHWPPLPAKLLSAIGVFGFNFTLRKTMLFSRSIA